MTNTQNTKLSFITPTVLDEAFLFVMGASVKKTDNPIGFFGTGLKYAIAVTMRLGGSIVIQTCGQEHGRIEYSFRVAQQQLRGEDMSFIECIKTSSMHVHSETMRMPMTADYGKNWEPWMVLRELWSNTKDENGYTVEGDRTVRYDVDPDTGELTRHELPAEYTRIVLDCAEVHEAWLQRDKYFINEARKPIYENGGIAVYSGSSDVLFYRGIRVTKNNFKSALTYNMKSIPSYALSEDRTVDPHYVRGNVMWMLGKCDEPGVIRTALAGSLDDGNFEHTLPFGSYTIGEEMNDCYAREAIEFVKKHLDTAPTLLKQQVFQYLDKQDADRMYTACELTTVQRERFDECIEFLRTKGINFATFDIRISFSHEVTGYAVCKPQAKVIWLCPSKTLADNNYMRVTCMTLIEEYVHCRWHVDDESRDMQERYNEMVYELCKYGEVQ